MAETNATPVTSSAAQSPADTQTTPAQGSENVSNVKQGVEEAWNDDKYNALSSKYKNDPKEVGKALWSAQKEMAKLRSELEKSSKGAKQSSDSTQQSKSDQTDSPSKGQADKSSGPDQGLDKAETAAAQDVSPVAQAIQNSYLEVFQTGKLSPEAQQSLMATTGLPEADAKLLAEGLKYVTEQRMKQAQSQVDTPIQDLIKFAETEGNFTDAELVRIQQAIDAGFYGIMKDVNTRYKATQKKTVEHGTVSQTVSNGDGYKSYSEYNAAKADRRYGPDAAFTAEVNGRLAASDKTNWIEEARNFKRK